MKEIYPVWDITGPFNGLSPVQYHAISQTEVDLLSFGKNLSRTKFFRIGIKIKDFFIKKNAFENGVYLILDQHVTW